MPSRHRPHTCICLHAGLRRTTCRRTSDKAECIAAFLQEYEQGCDIMPDSDHIHAPHATKAQVFELYQARAAECTDGTYRDVSGDYFNKVWEERFPRLKLRHIMPKFAKCSRCEQCCDALAHEVNQAARAKLKRELNMHLKVRLECLEHCMLHL